MNTLIILAATITLTWYDGPGPNTACGQPFATDFPGVAAPPSMGLSCGDKLVLSHGDQRVVVVVWDAMPQASADRYGGLALDATPAVMDGLKIAYGTDPVPWGRQKVTARRLDARAPRRAR